MLHTKFQGYWPFGSREEDFLRFLPYMGMAAILVMWPGTFEQTFVPPSNRSSIWNLTLIGPVVSDEKMFKECGRRRTTEAYLSYKLTKQAFGPDELLRVKIRFFDLHRVMKPVVLAKILQEALCASWNFSFTHWLHHLMNIKK